MTSSIFLNCFPLHFLKHSLSLNLKLVKKAHLTGQEVSGFFCLVGMRIIGLNCIYIVESALGPDALCG